MGSVRDRVRQITFFFFFQHFVRTVMYGARAGKKSDWLAWPLVLGSEKQRVRRRIFLLPRDLHTPVMQHRVIPTPRPRSISHKKHTNRCAL